MAVFVKKVQTIIRRCMVSIGGTLGCIPSSTISNRRSLYNRHVAVPESTYRIRVLVELRGALADSLVMEQEVYALLYRFFKAGSNMSTPSILGLTSTSQSLPSGSGTLQMPNPLGLAFVPFQSPYSTSFGFFGFRSLPPPGTVGSSTSHQPISQASSSNEEEWADDMDVV
ncbi:hypothetical protein M9H77_09154 [Catharanthus roseus]|uniref:Uncharacterized protein n=1 Tax=Catharanthus roseus TaxID=4058 RepID=A0ACC0C009_CATRO|nr:hypothetical protein M9H77_09154 [Catharanthus roseus]